MNRIDPSLTVGELVVERPSRARLFEHLGLDYCCGGGRSLEEACATRGLDTGTVIAALEAEAEGTIPSRDWRESSLAELCDHLVAVHHARLRSELPRLSALLEKVAHAHGAGDPSLLELGDVFEGLRAELEAHLRAEEESAFPAVRRLEHVGEEGAPVDRGELAALEDDHERAGAALRTLRALAGNYAPERARCNTHRATLDALRELELDLHEHIHEENNVLFPRALALLEGGACR